MIRTQIQLPDHLHRRLHALADQQEWSLAEAIRRGAELLLARYPEAPAPPEEWALPEPFHLGPPLAPVERWRELANTRED